MTRNRNFSWKSFLKNEDGSAIPFIGFTLLALLGASGAAIDMSRAQLAQSRMANALDAAGLAAGSVVSTTDAGTMATRYFNANFNAATYSTTITKLTAVPSTDKTLIVLDVTGNVNTTFMKLFGVKTVKIAAHSEITRSNMGMELVLVMDNTGSMSDPAGSSVTKLQASKTAATTLLNILYGSKNVEDNLYVGLVPFSQAVNIGTSHMAWLDTTYDNTLDFGPAIPGSSCPAVTNYTTTYQSGPKCLYKRTNNNSTIPTFAQANWKGCVESRSNNSATPQYDITDDTPTTKPFRMYFWPNDVNNAWITQTSTGNGGSRAYTTTFDYNSNKGPNAYCPQAISPMVIEKSTIINAVNTMTAQGNTHIDLGLAWGWRLLSPKWRNLWGGEMSTYKLPLDYNTPLMNKVVVLMTDGDNTITGTNSVTNSIYSAYGYPYQGQLGANACNSSGNCATGIAQMNTRTSTICANMKAQGILIYTVALGTDVSTTAQTLLKNCASKPEYYFLSPTTDTLQTAFQQIGDSLANLRISK
jgi:Flp pilus assembly protein TadG